MQKSLNRITNSILLVLITSFVFTGDKVKAENKNHVTQEIGKGVIDWTDKMIKVTGSGAAPADKPVGQARLLAERAAIADAYRQLAEIIYGVRVDSETIVKDFTVESDTIKTKVDGLIKGARRGEKRLTPDGNVEYDLYVQMFGQSGLADVIDLEKHIAKNQKVSFNLKKFHKSFAFNFANSDSSFFKIANSPDNQNSNCLECHVPHAITPKMKNKVEFKNPVNQTPAVSIDQNQQNNGLVTGVIIDATGLGLAPAMDPAVYDPDLKRVYIGNWEIDADFVVNNGVIGYFNDLEEARKDVGRVGTNPIIIKANSTRGVTDLILEADSANKLTSSDLANKFLQKYAVNVVM